MYIAVDFDGTCVDNKYPNLGADVPGAEAVLKDLVKNEHQLILYTMRSDQALADAITWFVERGLPLAGVQSCPGQEQWTGSPKAYAHVYIDDAALGCPLTTYSGFGSQCVDWSLAREWLIRAGYLKEPLT